MSRRPSLGTNPHVPQTRVIRGPGSLGCPFPDEGAEGADLSDDAVRTLDETRPLRWARTRESPPRVDSEGSLRFSGRDADSGGVLPRNLAGTG